jgi:hypothetical protein
MKLETHLLPCLAKVAQCGAFVNFAMQESIVKTVEAAVASLQFTATLNCALAEVEAAPVIDDGKEATSDVVDMADVVDGEATPVSGSRKYILNFNCQVTRLLSTVYLVLYHMGCTFQCTQH